MDDHFVWMTTRRIGPDTLEDFETAWRLASYPQGMRRAYAYWSEDEQEIIERFRSTPLRVKIVSG